MASVCAQRLALQPSHVQHAPHRLSILVSTFLPSVITWMVPPFDQNNTCDVCMLLNARTISHLPHHVPCCVARWFPHYLAHLLHPAARAPCRLPLLLLCWSPFHSVLCCFSSTVLPLDVGVLLGFVVRSALFSKLIS